MDNTDLYKQLYTLLEQNIFFGDRLDERQFVSLLVPGQFVSTKLKKHNAEDDFNIFNLTDKTIDSTFLWRPLISSVSGLYGEIVNFAALPDKTVDQALIKRLTNQLKGMQADYDKYEQYYDDADSAWRKANSQDPIDDNLVIDLEKKRAKALSQWKLQGHYQEYTNTLGELNFHLSGNPRAFWQTEVKQRYDNLQRVTANGSTYYDTTLSTHPSDWDAAGWEQHEIHVKSVWTRDYSRSTSFSASAGASFGLWSVGGSYSKSTQETQSQSKVTDIDIKLEILRVDITRPWMYRDLFARRFWGWLKATHENLLISDGGSFPDTRPLGPRGMPVLPTVFFVVRNVTLTGDWSDEDRRYYATQTQTGASFGWGPFSCSGSYNESTSEKTYSGEFAGATITIKQPQILAVGGICVPYCPHPEPSLAWSTNPQEAPWLTPPSEKADLELVAAAQNAQMLDLMRQRLKREYVASETEKTGAMTWEEFHAHVTRALKHT